MSGKWETCCVHHCKVQFFLPEELYQAALHSRGPINQGGIQFYCPYGHQQHYIKGESPEDKLRRERDVLAQRVVQKDDEIRYQQNLRQGTERRLSAVKGMVTRIKNRVGHGVCPCCDRSFQNLTRHMSHKHPDYAKSPVEA